MLGVPSSVDHCPVDRDLIGCDETVQRRRNSLLDVLHGELDTLAAVAVFITVTQLQRLVFSSGSPTRHSGAPSRSARKGYVGFDGGIATAVDNFTRANIQDC